MSKPEEITENRIDPDYTITAVERACELLEAVAAYPGSSLTDLARITGFTRSLAFRLAFTLEKSGYILKSSDGRKYYLGYRPLHLSASAQDHLPLLQAARPFIDDLANRTGQNVNLVVRDGLNHLTVLSKHPSDPNQLYARAGRLGPLHAGGAPKILLAFAPENVRKAVLATELKKFTDHTVVDPEKLSVLLDTIRKTGLNETRRDLDVDGFSFAAAVYDVEGTVIAAVSLAGRLEGLTPERTEHYREAVRTTGQRISETLGWRHWSRLT